MEKVTDVVKSADWKSEKHVPAIECADQVTAGEPFSVTVTLGKEVAHPNTTEHHIRWISLYFLPEGSPVPFHVSRVDFAAHGEGAEGPNTGPVYTHHTSSVELKIAKSGTLQAVAYCNIHGLWESTKAVSVG